MNFMIHFPGEVQYQIRIVRYNFRPSEIELIPKKSFTSSTVDFQSSSRSSSK